MLSTATFPKGVYTAALTPLNKDQSINYDLLVAHCQHLLDEGSQGIALLGTTGEANSFSLEERRSILEKTLAGGIPPEKLMVGTGCCSLPETINLTRQALQHQVKGVLVLPPFYYKQVTQNGLLNYFESFIEQVNDDRLRIYLYHIPKMSGLPFSIPLIKQLKSKYPAIIAGIKDSNGDFENMKAMVEQIPDFQVFAGTERYLLDVLKIGGAGCISATANVTIPLAAQVFKTWKSNQPTEALQDHLVKVRTAFEGLPFTGALKSYLANTTDDYRWTGVRPPNEPLNSEALDQLKERLQVLGFLD